MACACLLNGQRSKESALNSPPVMSSLLSLHPTPRRMPEIKPDIKQQVAESIRAARLKKGLTQGEVALLVVVCWMPLSSMASLIGFTQ